MQCACCCAFLLVIMAVCCVVATSCLYVCLFVCVCFFWGGACVACVHDLGVFWCLLCCVCS